MFIRIFQVLKLWICLFVLLRNLHKAPCLPCTSKRANAAGWDQPPHLCFQSFHVILDDCSCCQLFLFPTVMKGAHLLRGKKANNAYINIVLLVSKTSGYICNYRNNLLDFRKKNRGNELHNEHKKYSENDFFLTFSHKKATSLGKSFVLLQNNLFYSIWIFQTTFTFIDGNQIGKVSSWKRWSVENVVSWRDYSLFFIFSQLS